MAPSSPGKNRGRCDVGVNALEPSLPVIGSGPLAVVRRSRTGKWRAGVLIGVHALVAAHITHFIIAGRTLSPVEPSESMYTLEQGFVNCGFVFFAVALLGTLVFGRFFCGWACHIVALQDLCGWMMKKLGVRPRPFRSRLLVFTPIVLALYMFVWPSFLRLVLGRPSSSFPGFTNHFLTSFFWATFPGPVFAALTFLSCGFAAVYFLGAKGFCTYGCPYGAMFSAADVLSPGKIVVSDACEQCGHCTATCTSNVRVHEEVKLFGMVVDPGCMKCMDCVSVCPKGALSFGFAKPSIFKGKASAPRAKKFDLSLGEELLLGGVCLGAIFAFRGLYDGPPLLMSVGLGGLTAFGALKIWHLARRPSVRIQNLNLKLGGRIESNGRIFASVAALWLLFTAHSGFVQWHRAWGRHWLERTEASHEDVLSGAFHQKTYSPSHQRAAEEAYRHFTLADRWGLAGVVEVDLGLAWTHLLRDEPDAAEAAVRKAVALSPRSPALQRNLYEILMARGRASEAADALRRKIELEESEKRPGSSPAASHAGPSAAETFELAGALAEAGRSSEAIEQYRLFLALEPRSFEALYNLGGLLRRQGRDDEAIEQLRAATQLMPSDSDAHVELGLALMAKGDVREALAELKRGVELNPDSPESRLHLRSVIEQLEASSGAKAHP